MSTKEVTVKVVYVNADSKAKPVSRNGRWVCSMCGDSCYYDGRCGDGPILMCRCPQESDGWESDSR